MFDKLFEQRTKNKLPKPRVLSSSATLKILGPDSVEIPVGEIDGFSAKKSFEVVKRWKPYGSKFEEILTEDKGWELSFFGGKVDWNLANLIYVQEVAMVGITNSNILENGAISLYNSPKFDIYHEIIHYDGSVESFTYKDVSILDYDQATNPDNVEIEERISAFSPRRTSNFVAGRSAQMPQDLSKINSVVASILKKLL